MPKIEVNEEVFYTLAGHRWNTKEELEDALTCAKAELDEDSDKNLPESERILKIELNDTNRPDLWGTAGCARQLRVYRSGEIPEYPFFSRAGDVKKAQRKVKVENSVQKVRPIIAGFIASGISISDPALRDMIQTQEKLAWNFGRKRRSVSMGLYRIEKINWPIIYKGVNPDSVSFIPLQWETPLTLTEILKQHPKGKEFAFILEKEPVHPLLVDSSGNILSYPPIINSADLGAVQVGDSDIFVEFTGTDISLVTLATSIVACDFADRGFNIEPVEFEYDFNPSSQGDGIFGKNIVFPYYFQEPVFCSLARIEKFLGEKISGGDCVKALTRMGVKAEIQTGTEREQSKAAIPSEGILAWPPEYRNDFLHAADITEDVMIGRGLNSFKSERPSETTIGRLTPATLFGRQVKEIFIGMGYQEMIYNYLGSYSNLVEKMRASGVKTAERIIRIANPMTENYEYVRDTIIASLMESESVSGHSVYPHKIFEVGKVAYLESGSESSDSSGTVTRQYAGFLHADKEANFNTAAGHLQTLFYYLSREYDVEESSDPRFIPGRAAAILYKGNKIGVFGEIHPEVLENRGVTVPCIAGEIDLDSLL